MARHIVLGRQWDDDWVLHLFIDFNLFLGGVRMEDNNRERKLEEALAQKDQELKKLASRVNELESKLMQRGTNTEDLLKYYQNKYLNYYQEILKCHEEERVFSKRRLEKEIDDLKVAHQKAEELIKKNEDHQKRISNISDEENQVKQQISECNQKFNQALDDFLVQINQMNFDNDQMYLSLLSQFNETINQRLSFENFFEELSLYQTYLETKGFEKVMEIKNLQEKLKEKQDDLSLEKEELVLKLEKLKEDKGAEQAELVDTDLFDIEDQLFSKKTTYQDFDEKTEKMVHKFNELKDKHLQNFKEVLYKLNLYDYSAAEIGREFEKLLDLFVQELNMADGDEHNHELRQKEILSLKERAEQIEKEKIELPHLEEELSELQKTYSEAHQEITEMERYIAKCQPLIEPSSRYYDWYVSIKALQEKMNRLTQEKDEQLNYVKQLYKDRKSLVHNPFAKDQLRTLDEKILSEEAKVQTIMTSIDDTITVWKTIDNNSEQARFKSILSQKVKFEDKLPVLYQSLNELKQVIDEKYNRITEIKAKILTLDRLYEEIEDLENEDNN